MERTRVYRVSAGEEKPEPTPETTGGLGGNLRDKGVRDTRLISRAISKQWDIPEADKGRLINRQIKIALDPMTDDREAISAFRGILAANAQNMEQESRDDPNSRTFRHEHAVDIASIRQQLISKDQECIDAVRERHLRAIVDAGPICRDGEPGTVADGKAPGDSGQTSSDAGGGKDSTANGEHATEARQE